VVEPDPCNLDGGFDPSADAGPAFPCGRCKQLFFGEPRGAFEIDGTNMLGSVSPDGLRFMARSDSYTVGEYTRSALNQHFTRTQTHPFLDGDFWPRLTKGGYGLFLSHGSGYVTYYERSLLQNAFPPMPAHYFTPLTMSAKHLSFTPSADGRHLVFWSNRRTATDLRPSVNGAGYLWTAEALEPNAIGAPEFSSVTRQQSLPVALYGQNSTTAVPVWLSDDGLTLLVRHQVFAAPTFDIFTSSRTSLDAGFGPVQTVPTLSGDEFQEESFSLPSIATLEGNSCRADGYLRRGVDPYPYAWFRVPVCLGQPCPVEQGSACRFLPTDGGFRDAGEAPDASATALYFGVPQPITPINAKRFVALTPANDRLISGSGQMTTLFEHFQRDGGFVPGPDITSATETQASPHMTADLTGLFACDGVTDLCGFWKRASPDAIFPSSPVAYFEAVPPWGSRVDAGARNGATKAVVPTPSGEYIAFGADWVDPNCNLPSAGNDDLDLWTARAINTADPALGFTDFMRHPRASTAMQDVPQWLSDDGLTLIFSSGGNLFQTTRSSLDTDFEAGTPISNLEDDMVASVSFTLPSQAYLNANPGGYGYLVRHYNPFQWYRVPVCVGAPCP